MNTLPGADAPPTLESLPDDPQVLRGMIMQLIAANAKLTGKIATLQQQVEQLSRRVFGRSSERWDPNQTLLDALLVPALEQRQPAVDPPAVGVAVPAHTRKVTPHGRTIFPETLRHEVIVIAVPEAERLCPVTGQERPVIGYEEVKKLEYRRSELFVNVYRREKRGSVTGAEEVGVVTAPPPAGPIAKGLLDNGLMSHVVVSKIVDHLPLYRLETMFERDGVHLPRQTLCDSMLAASDPLQGLVERVKAKILANGVVLHDDTPVDLVGEVGRNGKHVQEARLWVGTVPVRDGPWTHFTFTCTREHRHVEAFFRDYTGKVMSDDFGGYDCLTLEQRAACLAHARRKFFDSRDAHPVEAAEMLERIKALYALEAQVDAAVEHDPERLAMRQREALPRFEAIKERLDLWAQRALPKSPLGKAVSYALNNWPRLLRYTQDPRLPIDNNAAEQAIRPIAIGRRNWLFMGSERGGHAAAIYMTLAATCKRAGINPILYFEDIFARIQDHSTHKLDELLPGRWQPMRPSR
jgi:transposase